MERYPIIGLIILVLSFATQLVRILRTREVAGISPWAIGQVVICSMFFSGYYISLKHWWALSLNILLILICAAILEFYRKYKG